MQASNSQRSQAFCFLHDTSMGRPVNGSRTQFSSEASTGRKLSRAYLFVSGALFGAVSLLGFRPRLSNLLSLLREGVVGVAGFEPATPLSQKGHQSIAA